MLLYYQTRKVTMYFNIQKLFPEVSYLKAIDYWNFFCFFLVFMSLLEFAVASVSNLQFLKKRKKFIIP